MSLPTPPLPSTSPAPPPSDASDRDPDDADAASALPLPTAASVVLDALPRDAAAALAGAGDAAAAEAKVTIRLHPVGAAPVLRQRVFKVAAGKPFATVLRALRRKLGLTAAESVFCYVNSVFAPGLEEGVGNLWECFKVKDELVVCYSVAPAFG